MNFKSETSSLMTAIHEGMATAQSEIIVGSVFRGCMGAARAHGYNISDDRSPETLEDRLAASAFMCGYDAAYKAMKVDIFLSLDSSEIVRIEPRT